MEEVIHCPRQKIIHQSHLEMHQRGKSRAMGCDGVSEEKEMHGRKWMEWSVISPGGGVDQGIIEKHRKSKS